MDRVFLRSQFAVYYRRARRLRLTSEARSDYAVIFPLEGILTASVAGEEMEASHAGALLINPGSAVSIASREEAAFLMLTLTPAFVLDLAVRLRLTLSGATVVFSSERVEKDERLAQLARDLTGEMIEEEAGQDVVITAQVEQALVHLLRHHANVRRSDELELSRVGLVDRRIRRAVEMMHAHMERDLPIEELASAAYLSPFHFARLFKKLTGASPHAYLASLRVQRAQQLLAETDLSISELSARVGYSSPSHFSKAFRQATGLTPRAFRASLVRAD
ncbi:MAG TPA: helix-turn-helix domain-containing protein [Pyrinomonadaceae bacterium]|nr:helix-turn-helix domain-containing protein [Pyrinomonadaceae bacterium]